MTWKTAIEKLMARKNMSKAELARKSGLTSQYITELLHEDRAKRKTNPSFETVMKIANALGVQGFSLWRLADDGDAAKREQAKAAFERTKQRLRERNQTTRS